MYEFAVTPAVTQLRRRGVEITEVAPASLGAEVDLAAGDRIIKVNGRMVRDYLDFRFHTSGETDLLFEVKKRNGEHWEIELERDEGEDLGLTLEAIAPRQCANECLFCFCKGNPSDARPSLFIRDEDIRLSFLYGNYTTLTSLSADELNRIIEQNLSPQYVSVHATDLETRAYLLGVDKKRADISEKFQRLLDAGIEIHAQVVLCPNINDGAILEKTVRDLAAFYPRVSSVAIVPLGLTRYNTDARLTAVTPEFCRRVIAQITPLQNELRQQFGRDAMDRVSTFAFLGDEIYLKAGQSVPARAHYGDYPQIEDGIGMVRSFENWFTAFLRRLSRQPEAVPALHGTMLTGELFAPVLRRRAEQLNAKFGMRLKVVAVKNEYFGGDVAVAGLLTGRDLLAAQPEIVGDFVTVPPTVLKTGEPVMLDGMRLDELQARFGVLVHVMDKAGWARLFGLASC